MTNTTRVEAKWRWDAASLIAGAVLPLAFAPLELFPLAWLAPAVMFLLWRISPPRDAARRGFLFGLGMFGVGVSWVYVAIHDFGNTGAFVSALLTLGFVAILSLYPAVLGWLSATLIRRSATSSALSLLVLLPALWTLFEWIRGRFLTGFPWLNLGYSQIDTPLSGFAPVMGVYGLSLVTAITAGALAYAAVERNRRGASALLLPLALWIGAWALGDTQWTHPVGSPLNVSLVQGDQPQLTKWDSDKIEQRLTTYARLTIPELGRSDLVVWPENAVTLFYSDLPEYFAWLERKARESGSDIVLGVPVLAKDKVNYYTAMMSLGSHHGFYRKRHLVPFGEFVPLAGALRGLIGFFDLPMSSFSPGPEDQAPLSVVGQRAAVSICYEDAFGEEIIKNVPQSTLLINGSNNAWYGNSLAPHQHLEISRMRALETGRPLLRATTNGISAVVDAKGRILERTPQFQQYVLRGSIQPRTGITPYTAWGNIPVLLLIAIAFTIAVALPYVARVRAATREVEVEG